MKSILYKLLRDYPKLYLSKKNHLRSLTLAISDQNNLNNSIAHKDKNETALNANCVKSKKTLSTNSYTVLI